MITKIKDIIVKEQQCGNLTGLIAVHTTEIEEIKDPTISYSGGRIRLETWINLVSFLRWAFDEHGCEAQVRLFYNDQTAEWDWAALPQYICSGLSSEEIKDHDDKEGIINSYIARGFLPFGTVHQHCNAGAFQSGTDHKDEIEQPGLHITLGNLSNEEAYSIHSRVNFRKIFYTPELSEWFNEMSEDWVTFPWCASNVPQFLKDRMIEKPKPAYRVWESGSRLGNQHHGFGSYGTLGNNGSRHVSYGAWDNYDGWYDEHYPPAGNSSTPPYKAKEEDLDALSEDDWKRRMEALRESRAAEENDFNYYKSIEVAVNFVEEVLDYAYAADVDVDYVLEKLSMLIAFRELNEFGSSEYIRLFKEYGNIKSSTRVLHRLLEIEEEETQAEIEAAIAQERQEAEEKEGQSKAETQLLLLPHVVVDNLHSSD